MPDAPTNPTPTREEPMTWDRLAREAQAAVEEGVLRALSPTPTREEVVAALRDEMLTITGDMSAVVRIQSRGPVHRLAMARAALALLTEPVSNAYTSAPDPWGEGDAEWFDNTAAITTPDWAAARYRRAAQRARGVAVTEDGR